MVTRSDKLSSLLDKGRGLFLLFQMMYEDDALLVCIKEAGIATQTRSIGQRDMESMLRTYRMQKGEPSYIGVVHRLDQPVSGVMVFAKTKEAAAALAVRLRRAADKYYYAVTDGLPQRKSGRLENYLLRDGKTNLSRVVSGTTAGAKRAELFYETLAQKNDRALLRGSRSFAQGGITRSVYSFLRTRDARLSAIRNIILKNI